MEPLERGFPALPKRFLFQWHITDRCNLSCAHCYQAPDPLPELDFASLRHLLDRFIDFLRLPLNNGGAPIQGHVAVTGGEPFLHSDFADFIETLAGHRDLFGFSVLTNGSLIDDETAYWLARQRPAFVQVSLDGTRKAHDRLRGDGNFHQTTAAIARMVKRGIRVLVSFTANAVNYREFGRVARICESLGVSRCWSDRMLPVGRGRALASLSAAQIREWLAIMRQAQRRAQRHFWNGTEVAMHRALQFLSSGGRPYRCTAGRTHLALLSDGTVLPCRRMPIPAGNLLRQSLASIYRENATLRLLRDDARTAAICPRCRYGAECGGGLRCMALAATGDLLAPDPACPLAEAANLV